MKKNLLKIAVIALITLFSATTFAQVKTAGTLTFTFNQPSPTSPAVTNKSNVLAVWIESSTGTFIKTRYRFASNSTSDHLPTWAAKSGGTLSNCMSTACNVAGAITGASRKATAIATVPTVTPGILNFGSKTVTWDGTDKAGVVVADGAYKVWVESSWNDGPGNSHNEIISFTFNKGTVTETLTPTGDSYINTVTTKWSPTLATDSFSLTPEAVIYPNPTNGIFNIDVKNAVNNIKVINLLGEEVYNEKVSNENAGTTKMVDLTRFVNGMYIVSLTNEVGTSNYKVILNK